MSAVSTTMQTPLSLNHFLARARQYRGDVPIVTPDKSLHRPGGRAVRGGARTRLGAVGHPPARAAGGALSDRFFTHRPSPNMCLLELAVNKQMLHKPLHECAQAILRSAGGTA